MLKAFISLFVNFCVCTYTGLPNENSNYVILYEVENVQTISVKYEQIIDFQNQEEIKEFITEIYPYLQEEIEKNLKKKNSTFLGDYFSFLNEEINISLDDMLFFFKENYKKKEAYKSSLITYCISNINGKNTDFKVSKFIKKHKERCCRGIGKAPIKGYIGIITGEDSIENFDWDLTYIRWNNNFSGMPYDSLIKNNYFNKLDKTKCDTFGECYTL